MDHRQHTTSAALAAVLADAGLPHPMAVKYGVRLAEAHRDGLWAVLSAALIVELTARGWSTDLVDELDRAVAGSEAVASIEFGEATARLVEEVSDWLGLVADLAAGWAPVDAAALAALLAGEPGSS